MCKHVFLDMVYVNVCKKCGITNRVYKVDSYNKYSAPLCRGYNRIQRFRLKLDKLFGIHNGPRIEDPIWKVLENCKKTLHCPRGIRAALRKSKLKNKHYDSVRIFTDIFTDFNIGFTPHSVKKRILNDFIVIHDMWKNVSPDTSFFSYDFLLKYLLKDSKLIVYCKPCACQKRYDKYLNRLKFIQARHGDRRSNHEIPKVHSQNGIRISTILRSPLWLLQDLS